MNFLDPKINFKRDAPFHALVVACITQSHGFLDLAARGMNKRWLDFIDEKSAPPELIDQYFEELCDGIHAESRDRAKEILKSKPHPLPGTHILASSMDNVIKVSTSGLSLEIANNYKAPLSVLSRVSAGTLLLMAWETTKETNPQKKEPLWQFLYHCRNAVAHKGFFNFKYNEPKKLSKWRNLEITESLQGTPLFKDESKTGFLSPGDAIYLLADIEKKYY